MQSQRRHRTSARQQLAQRYQRGPETAQETRLMRRRRKPVLGCQVAAVEEAAATSNAASVAAAPGVFALPARITDPAPASSPSNAAIPWPSAPHRSRSRRTTAMRPCGDHPRAAECEQGTLWRRRAPWRPLSARCWPKQTHGKRMQREFHRGRETAPSTAALQQLALQEQRPVHPAASHPCRAAVGRTPMVEPVERQAGQAGDATRSPRRPRTARTKSALRPAARARSQFSWALGPQSSRWTRTANSLCSIASAEATPASSPAVLPSDSRAERTPAYASICAELRSRTAAAHAPNACPLHAPGSRHAHSSARSPPRRHDTAPAAAERLRPWTHQCATTPQRTRAYAEEQKQLRRARDVRAARCDNT